MPCSSLCPCIAPRVAPSPRTAAGGTGRCGPTASRDNDSGDRTPRPSRTTDPRADASSAGRPGRSLRTCPCRGPGLHPGGVRAWWGGRRARRRRRSASSSGAAARPWACRRRLPSMPCSAPRSARADSTSTRCILSALANDALVLSEIDAFYGDSHVLHRMSLRLGEGRLLGLLGRNAAGKSTSLNVTVGLLPPRHGAVAVYGRAVTGRAPEIIAAQGVALVPQGRRVFRSLTVRENLAVAARKPRGGLPLLWTLETVSALFPRLQERQQQIAASLSGGEQQMLVIGRALMSNPRVLLMDEPSEGLAPQIVAEVMATIRRLKAQGLSIVLVEQNAKLVFDVADDIVILNSGRVVLEGSATDVRHRVAELHQHLGIY